MCWRNCSLDAEITKRGVIPDLFLDGIHMQIACRTVDCVDEASECSCDKVGLLTEVPFNLQIRLRLLDLLGPNVEHEVAVGDTAED